MTATYDDALSRPLDEVRTLIGDTDPTAALVSDAHVAAALARQGGDVGRAAAYVAQGLIARYAHRPTTETQGGVTVSYADRIPTWQRLAERLAAPATAADDGGAVRIEGVW